MFSVPVPLKVLPTEMPVIVLCVERFVRVLVEIDVVVPPMYVKFIAVMALVPPLQLLKVLPVTVLVGLVPDPSVSEIPEIAVAPVTEIFEKLLFV